MVGNVSAKEYKVGNYIFNLYIFDHIYKSF